MNMEQEVLNAFERGKAFGFAEGMKENKDRMALLEKRFGEELDAHHSALGKLGRLRKKNKSQEAHIAELEREPIPFMGWIDKEDTEQMLRDQLSVVQAECQRLKKKLMENGIHD